MHMTSIENDISLAQARVCPTGFAAIILTLFVLIHRLREFDLYAATDRIELRCQSKQRLLVNRS